MRCLLSAPDPGFDPTAAWRRSPSVQLRPEPFGALAYDFSTRRLSFLRSPLLVTLVDALASHDTASDAVDSVVPGDARPAFTRALATLAAAGTIQRRGA